MIPLRHDSVTMISLRELSSQNRDSIYQLSLLSLRNLGNLASLSSARDYA